MTKNRQTNTTRSHTEKQANQKKKNRTTKKIEGFFLYPKIL